MKIKIPDMSNFDSIYNWVHTVAHEIAHSSGMFLGRFNDQESKTVRQLCDEIGLEYIDYMSQNTHTIYRASAYQVDDALMAIGNAIYELEDKIHPDLRDDIGVTDALDLLYETYVKAVHYIRDSKWWSIESNDSYRYSKVSLRAVEVA